jgi:hypothetical protein
MARRTFANFDTELNMSLGKRAEFTSTIRDFVLDAAYYHVANVIRHPELETTATATLSAASDNITLASDFWFPELIFNDTDDRQIYPSSIPLTEVRTKPTGDPSAYTRWGGDLYFDKKPSTNKTIKSWYTKRPAEPSSGGNSILDTLYDQLILLYAMKFAYEEVRDFDQAGKVYLAIQAMTNDIRPPWRMTKTEDSKKTIRVRMR